MFVDRIKEVNRLRTALQTDKTVLLAIYGRRRCGKSTLIKKILTETDIYFAADMRETSLQIEAFAKSIDKVVAGFSKLKYPDWNAVFINLKNTLHRPITVCIDEFPYLVKNSPELPSILQNVIDNQQNEKYNLILCGSSQQMMQEMTNNGLAPLFGRCTEIINIKPLLLGWYKEYFNTTAIQTIEGYSVWGGVPRYWELQKQHHSLTKAIQYNLLETDGVLRKEPELLFSDEMRTSVLAFSILSLVGMGCHRLSEIAARLEKPATQLNRPINVLIDLGYIHREQPFNISEKATKKSLYKITDPFMNFYFTFIVPNKSRLEFGLAEQVGNEIAGKFNQYVSDVWEELCRQAVPRLSFNNQYFGIAKRWWGNSTDHTPIEIDIVAESVDKSTLLFGEVKWSNSIDFVSVANELQTKVEKLPFTKNKKIIYALFSKIHSGKSINETIVLTPTDVIAALK